MGEPGSETWGESPDHERNMASTWGLAGSYDPERNLLLWGIANPMPNTRMNRHGGNYAGTGFTAPADLYSNSTVALVPETGELEWYYQHLPGDDWDLDYTNERILVHTRIDPNPQQVRWYNEAARGQERDVAIVVGEGGGIFVIGRDKGKFLWAKPFPFETEHFLLSDIDPETGATHINRDLVLKEPGDHHIVCYWNTTSFWPSAYSQRTNSVYVPYIDNCLDMTAAEGENSERRRGILRPGHDPEKVAGVAKVNIETGETVYFGEQRSPSTAGVLATAGGVVFHGDTHRRFRAYDDETGEILWETIVGGPASVGIITYAVDGRQYVAMHTGDVLATAGTARQTGTEHLARQNILYVFALPE
jgi:alcohol dehydrogenase (cytochrome c)